MYICTNTRAYTHAIHTRVCTHGHMHAHMDKHTLTHVYARTDTCTYTWTNIHPHIQLTHVRGPKRSRSFPFKEKT